MVHAVKGVVVRSKGAPATLETVLVPEPGPGEALVDILTSGVCHTDLHYKLGGISDDFPFLLGHEATGVVSAVGPDVTDVAPGDRVVLNWRAVCGNCRACKRGEPQYCFNTHNATRKMTLEDGTELSPALGIGAFIEKTLVAAGQCTKVDPDADPAAVGLLGCGVMAGLGAALNTGGVKRGDSVAVIGCGGVGVAAIAGAALAGATTIIAVDIDPKKLELPLLDVFGRGGSLKSSWYGDCLPSRDFPMLVDLYKQGKLDLDAFVTERITINQVEEAFDKMHEGAVLRSVVEL